MYPNIFQISVYPIKGNRWEFDNKIFSAGKFKRNSNGENVEVSIQSVSKVFTAISTLKLFSEKYGGDGIDEMIRYIGCEESFMGFNDMDAHINLDHTKNIPFTINPFINAGAIATLSFIVPNNKLNSNNNIKRCQLNDSKTDSINTYNRANTSTMSILLDNIYRCIGNRDIVLSVSKVIFNSEIKWIHTNKKLALKLKELSEKYFNKMTNENRIKYFQGDDNTLSVDKALSNYSAICSMMVNSEKLVKMSYLLANNGINSSDEQILTCRQTRYILSIMTFAGMYNDSGKWFTKIGLPMKSGVGGSIIAIVPGQMAIAVVSPPLDKFGNSLLAGKAIMMLCKELEIFGLQSCGPDEVDIPKEVKKPNKSYNTLDKVVNLSDIENIIDTNEAIIKNY